MVKKIFDNYRKINLVKVMQLSTVLAFFALLLYYSSIGMKNLMEMNNILQSKYYFGLIVPILTLLCGSIGLLEANLYFLGLRELGEGFEHFNRLSKEVSITLIIVAITTFFTFVSSPDKQKTYYLVVIALLIILFFQELILYFERDKVSVIGKRN